MKAFDEWIESLNQDKDFGGWMRRPTNEMRVAWKAALEWAENQFVGKSAFEVEEAINKELRDSAVYSVRYYMTDECNEGLLKYMDQIGVTNE
jgi:hypothetical protein